MKAKSKKTTKPQLTKTKTKSIRYAAKLLFQYRVVVEGESESRRTCEESIINFQARGPKDALRHAKKRGRDREIHYIAKAGNSVFFEFVGVLDIEDQGCECQDDEVWYDIRTMVRPMERKDDILPSDKKLLSRIS